MADCIETEPMVTVRLRLSTLHAAQDALRDSHPNAERELAAALREATLRGLQPLTEENCPACGQSGRRDWIDISTHDSPNTVTPGLLRCDTIGCSNGWGRW